MSKVKVYEKKFFRVLIALALCSSVFPSAMPPMGMFALIDIILLAITRLTVELETMVQQTGIIGLMLVLSLLVKFLVLYLQLKLGSTHLVQLV